jgi:deoxyribodipyrimidine photo-lyase
MSKRTQSNNTVDMNDDAKPPPKRTRTESTFTPNKVATAAHADAVHADPPLPKLLKAVSNAIKNPAKGDSVVYWMRMADLTSQSSRVPHFFYQHC